MSFVAELEPQSLWSHFDAILEIPRPSKHEERIREHILDLARARGLECKVDDAGNVVVYKPASPGKEQAPTTILQAHLDMVLEKNSDVEHDFAKDPIRPQRDGEYLKATGTTLGSDNGIGVAAMLAVMDAADLVHGPLELLFTVDEETGLTGAGGLAPDLLHGRQLINCDSEEEGVLTIGCAGGADTHLELDLAAEPVSGGSSGIEVRLSGLKGGHSGIDIHLQRGNAIRLLARALYAASAEQPFRIVELSGGNAHNAIPREARARIVVDPAHAEALKGALVAQLDAARVEFRTADPGIEFSVGESAAPGSAWDLATTNHVLGFLCALPHGVMAMSLDIDGLVETSTNLAVVAEEKGKLDVLLSSRSSVASALTALRHRIRALGELAGAAVREADGYPGWQPDVESRMLDVVKQIHEQVTGSAPEVGAVHAGLECGIIGEKYPGMDMISFGPQIEFPHSPDERVKIDTVGTFYKLLTTTLEELAG